MEMAYQTLGLDVDGSSKQYLKNEKLQQLKIMRFGEGERAKVFTCYAKALALAKRTKSANKIMLEAIVQFTDTQWEVDILISNS